MPFRQVHEPCLLVLRNILYLSQSLQMVVFSLFLSHLYLITIHLLLWSQRWKEKRFSHPLIIQPSWLEELISLLSIFHSHCTNRFIQLICQQFTDWVNLDWFVIDQLLVILAITNVLQSNWLVEHALSFYITSHLSECLETGWRRNFETQIKLCRTLEWHV